MIKIEVVVGVQRNLILAIIVLQKITKEIAVVEDPNTNINLKNPKNTHETTIRVIIQILLMTVLIQTIAIIHKNMFFIFILRNLINTK